MALNSTFDTDAEGWTAVSMPDFGPYTALVGGPYPVVYEAASGNPGGAISMTDPDGVTFFFSAPAAYLGNQTSAYGLALTYDLKIAYEGWTDADVALYGAGMSLAVDAGPDPVIGVWTSYSVNLDTTGGWRVGTLNGALATEADIKAVLGDLQGLYIRGEFAYGSDYTLLDNVSVVPEASHYALFAGTGLIFFGVWRRVTAK